MTHTSNQSRRQTLDRHRSKLDRMKKDPRVPRKARNKAAKGVRLMERSLARIEAKASTRAR